MARVAHLRGSNTASTHRSFRWNLSSSRSWSLVLGLLVAYAMMVWCTAVPKSSPHTMDIYFSPAATGFGAFFSYSHGANDAMKTMGHHGVLVTADTSAPSTCHMVIFAAHTAIGLVHEWRLAHHSHHGSAADETEASGGFCAETGAAFHHDRHAIDQRCPLRTLSPARSRVWLGAARQGRALGFGDQYRMGMGAYNSGVGDCRVGEL